MAFVSSPSACAKMRKQESMMSPTGMRERKIMGENSSMTIFRLSGKMENQTCDFQIARHRLMR